MKLLELCVVFVVVHGILSLLLGAFVVDFKLENDPEKPDLVAPNIVGRLPLDGNSFQPNRTVSGGSMNEVMNLDIEYTDEQLPRLSFFPKYGSEAFFQQCNWALRKRVDTNTAFNCTLLVRPKPDSTEGLSDIVSQLVSGHLIAQQKHCRLFFDYGNQVDISQFVSPFSPLDDNDLYANYYPINWTVPSESELTTTTPLFRTEQDYNNGVALQRLERQLGHLAPIPTYRFVYSNAKHFQLNANHFDELPNLLSGYAVETGMACSLGSLLQLSPLAVKFEPNLFATILPTLHQDDAFVMALYIRTGRTDHLAGMQHAGKEPFAEDHVRLEYSAKRIIACAQRLEREYESQFTRIVWMVATDSQYLKQWMTNEYDTTNHTSTTNDTLKRRQVVTTLSRGAHTRGKQRPSTADVAEAFIDWYLIGESHVVVTDTNSPSFGGTAALRTARPYYRVPIMGDPADCSLVPVVR